MKRLMIIGLWPDDVVKYCTEKCDCRRYAFDRIIYHRGGRAARERICIPVVDRSGAVTTYLNLHSQKTAAELLPGVRPPVEENKKGG